MKMMKEKPRKDLKTLSLTKVSRVCVCVRVEINHSSHLSPIDAPYESKGENVNVSYLYTLYL